MPNVYRVDHVGSLLRPAQVKEAKAAFLNGSQTREQLEQAEDEAILVALDLEQIDCSLGSTCSSGSAEPAPALVAMGCPEDVYRASVRFSVAVENTVEEIDEAVRRIVQVVQRLRESASVA